YFQRKSLPQRRRLRHAFRRRHRLGPGNPNSSFAVRFAARSARKVRRRRKWKSLFRRQNERERLRHSRPCRPCLRLRVRERKTRRRPIYGPAFSARLPLRICRLISNPSFRTQRGTWNPLLASFVEALLKTRPIRFLLTRKLQTLTA